VEKRNVERNERVPTQAEEYSQGLWSIYISGKVPIIVDECQKGGIQC